MEFSGSIKASFSKDELAKDWVINDWVCNGPASSDSAGEGA
jgi:hypothetical protein